MNWRPIETAPKDRRVLVYCDGGWPHQIAHWSDDDQEWVGESREGLHPSHPPTFWAELTIP